jgi:hypothetical protein
MWPVIIPAAIAAAGAIGGGYLSGRNSGQETKMQKTQRNLVDQLLKSLETGSGPYADLFKTDESAFQKSIVEPAQARFRNQTAPNIQQQYIESGQQRGTGMEDQLLRAGVDLDQLINQSYMDFQKSGKDRMSQMLGNVLGSGSGGTQTQAPGQAMGQATAGYLSSDAFQNSVNSFFPKNQAGQAPLSSNDGNTWDMYAYNQRKGFANT